MSEREPRCPWCVEPTRKEADEWIGDVRTMPLMAPCVNHLAMATPQMLPRYPMAIPHSPTDT